MPSGTKPELRRIAMLEKRVAQLERAAVKFEEHRQAAIWLNKKLKVMKDEMDAADEKRLQRQLAVSKKAAKHPL